MGWRCLQPRLGFGPEVGPESPGASTDHCVDDRRANHNPCASQRAPALGGGPPGGGLPRTRDVHAGKAGRMDGRLQEGHHHPPDRMGNQQWARYKHLDQDDEVAFSVWNVNDVYDDPCNWRESSLSELDLGDDQVHEDFHEVATGSSVPKPLNGGLANQLLRNASQMTSVELGGVSALRIELSVPGWLDLAACDQGQFRSWKGWGTPGADANAHHTPGQIDVVYMVDVDRRALVIDASYKPATSPSDLAELEAILASMIVE